MKILSLDTAMAACSAAIIDTDAPLPLAAAYVPMERGHAEALPPMIAAVLKSSGIGLSEIERLAVTTGPGTFTGLRIGLSFARGLGLSRSLPVAGIDSLTAIAANEASKGAILVASDARNGEVYAALFDAEHRPIRTPHVATASSAAANAPSGARVLGTAAQAVIEASGRHDLVRSHAGDLPVAAHFARIAAAVSPRGMPAPLYLRAPDAKPQSGGLRKLGGLTIETVGSGASGVLSELHGEIFGEAWSEKSFRDMLEVPGTKAAIITQGAEPLGLIVTRHAADEAEIITIGSRPSMQRRGVARQLLEQHIASLATSGIRHVFLEVAASNTPAQNLYTSCGFTESGRRKGYYKRREEVEDAIVMRRELLP